MIIDIFNHIEPMTYVEAAGRHNSVNPLILDVERRLRIMDRFGDYMQVLTVGGFHAYTHGDKAVELAQVANDGVAELVAKYPEWFAAGVASLPLKDMDAALRETDRAIMELKFRGVEIWAHRDREPLDSEHYFPLYEKLSEYNLPIWIHPMRKPDPDYSCEKESKYQIWSIFGWPFETTIAMARMVFSGVFERFPNLKFITHHCGAMVPYFASRIDCLGNLMRDYNENLSRPLLDYFRMFYADTALEGGKAALECAYDFFGAKHMLFGTDMPMDSRIGVNSIAMAIQAIEGMDIPSEDKKRIFERNARQLLRLPI
jgi:predicted TIM-barrel fold metal-dependent hydrolase